MHLRRGTIQLAIIRFLATDGEKAQFSTNSFVRLAMAYCHVITGVLCAFLIMFSWLFVFQAAP